MTLNSHVKSDQLPAATHVDGTARIQTVDASAGSYRDLIQAISDINGVPVVLNTSFNGPGEPIVDMPSEALAFLVNSELDALYIQGYRVHRK
jgi:carbamoyltransferase